MTSARSSDKDVITELKNPAHANDGEAISSHRSGRAALGVEVALKELRVVLASSATQMRCGA